MNAEVPLSAVCETEAFLWFAAHLLAQLPRFHEIHNDALFRYRALYHIRSRNHPVSALVRQDDWLEAPFWVWRASSPRRRPLLARQLPRRLQLRIAGEEELLVELPLSPDGEACCAVERLQELPARGVRLRTRALTTTMFARYLLGDLFLHGIGGAKYDELGDAVSGRFFGIQPPSYLTLSMTLRLGLDVDPSAPARIAASDQLLRDLTYNPDRHLESDALVAESQRLVEAKHQLLVRDASTAAEKRSRFREIRTVNAAMLPFVAARRAAVERERAALVLSARRLGLASSREYASVLHSRARLRIAMGQALPGFPRAEGS